MNRTSLKMKGIGLLTTLCLTAGFSNGQTLSGTKTVGKPTSNYPNLTGPTGLFQAINTNGVNGTLTVLIDSSIIEPGTNGLNDFTSGGTLNNYVRIQPATATNMIVSTSATDTMVKLYGVRNLTIDGSFNGSGRYMTFRNTNATKNSAVVSFISSCSYDTLRNTIFEGSNILTAPANGAATLSTGSVGGVIVLNAYNIAGNKKIAIIGNILKNVAGTSCNVLLRALSNGGTTPNFNDNDSVYIYKNHFINANLVAIQLGTNNTRPGPWVIDNNYFYNTETYSTTSTRNIVNLYQGLGHTFTNNIMGGSDSTAGGSPMTFSGTAPLTMVSTTSNFSTSLVQTQVAIKNNKIGNISIDNSGGNGTYNCISGSAYTEIANNTIGGIGTANALTTNTYSLIGINISGPNNYVHDNSIRNITSTFAGISTSNRGVNGIGISATVSTVENNIIDSIVGKNASYLGTLNVANGAPSGIYVASMSSPGGTVVNKNTITNIINTDNSLLAATGATVTGINIANVAFQTKFTNNYISNIYGLNASGSYSNNVSGILDARANTTNLGADTFMNNVIALGDNITAQSWVKGIDITSGGNNTPFYFLNNSVNISSGLTLNSTAFNAAQSGAS